MTLAKGFHSLVLNANLSLELTYILSCLNSYFYKLFVSGKSAFVIITSVIILRPRIFLLLTTVKFIRL